MSRPSYVLGTGLSHDGSAVLLKDGNVCVAIEKERITRYKHDGGNDADAVNYCLQAEGIGVGDLDLVVQCANFEKDEIERDSYRGPRPFEGRSDLPMVAISHHLAHAYSTIGTAPFNEFNILVIDGCGSPFVQCDDLAGTCIPERRKIENNIGGFYCEKDSYYRYRDGECMPLFKDFAAIPFHSDPHPLRLPTIEHSIGGLYSSVSNYCFGNLDDAGKLMGLAPYGRAGAFSGEIFELREGRVFVRTDWMEKFDRPVSREHTLQDNFRHYADLAYWVQSEVERALCHVAQARLEFDPAPNLCYAGGVALNAVANARLLREGIVENLYIEPAAGDNGIALGAAFYGWLKVLGKERRLHDGSTCFGVSYSLKQVAKAVEKSAQNGLILRRRERSHDPVRRAAELLGQGKIIGWFRDGAEFGPRALGRRSILADPRIEGVRDRINRRIKFREDFRPFAPAVPREDLLRYFLFDIESPYMILVNRVRPEWRKPLRSVVHEDDSSRVQTVTPEWNTEFYHLLRTFGDITGMPVLLNTSFNRRGMPIVETPDDAIDFFHACDLDCLVVGDMILEK